MNASVKVIISTIDKATAPIRAIGGQLRRLGSAAGGLRHNFLSAMLPVTALTAGLGALIIKYAEYSKELQRTAFRLGLTTDALQEYRYAAKRSGVDTESFEKGFQRFTKIGGDALYGAKSPIKAFQRLGVSLKDNKGALKTTDALFMDVMTSLSKITDPLKRNAAAANFFGARNLKLTQMLMHGAKGIREYREQAEAMGFVLKSKAVKAFAEFGGILNQIKMVTFNLAGSILGDYMPSINKAANAALKWVQTHQKLIKTRIHEFFTKAIPAIDKLGTNLGALVTIIDRIAVATGGWGNIINIGLLVHFSPLIASIIQIVGVIGGAIIQFTAWVGTIDLAWGAIGILGEALAVISNPITWIIAGVVALAGAALLIYNNWDKISAWFVNMWNEWGGVIRLLFPPIGWVVDAAELLMQNWEPIKAFFKDVMNGVVSAFTWAAAEVMKVWKPIEGFFNRLGGAIAGAVTQIKNAAPNGNIFTGQKSFAASYAPAARLPQQGTSPYVLKPKHDRLEVTMTLNSKGMPFVTGFNSKGSSNVDFTARRGPMVAHGH